LKLNGGQKRSRGSDGSKLPLLQLERSLSSLEREIRNGIGGEERPFERAAMDADKRRQNRRRERGRRRRKGVVGGGRSDAMAPNSRSFDRKDLSIERSGTV
jgi:hypothetical protein